MAQIVFDPENESKPWQPLTRFDMRSPALRQKQREVYRRKRQAASIAAAERDRKIWDACLAESAARAAAAREALRAKAAAMRDEAVAESAGEVAKIARGKLYGKQTQRLAIIQYRALRLFRITLDELHGNSRTRHVVLAKQFVSYWSCRLTGLSLGQIGKRVGGKDHTTILHGCKAYVEKRAARKPQGRYLRPAR